MTKILITNLDDNLKARLQSQAIAHGRSIEDEAGEIIRLSLSENLQISTNLAASIRERFATFGDLDLPEVSRTSLIESPFE